ncbi:helix-turn-helix transcriptional regulator [Phytoactinopolyspora limicola]|uniref:helix-turn-helix transcriptional regulator n=1 Tax=Phytoactinopolyspora limicola TaxID=2715536 RepID=UPI00140D3875|nr:helix-turn-helix domain-containing protein [Phytoactinopolyspora limicola]
MYTERPSSLPSTILWTGRAEHDTQVHRVLPDGCMDIILAGDALYVAGPDTTAHQTTWTRRSFTGLRFGHGVGPRVIGIPAHHLRNRLVLLADVWPAADTRRLTEQLRAAPAPGDLLERVVARRLDQAEPPDPLARFTEERLRAGWRVDDVAAAAGLSSRQLHRRSLDAFGYGPKTLARILRFNHALRLGRRGVAAAEAAVVSGYADQAHLARETRALGGTTFRSLVA